jgi:hypothetical protein
MEDKNGLQKILARYALPEFFQQDSTSESLGARQSPPGRKRSA